MKLKKSGLWPWQLLLQQYYLAQHRNGLEVEQKFPYPES